MLAETGIPVRSNEQILVVTSRLPPRSLRPLSYSPIFLQRFQYRIERGVPIHLPTRRARLNSLFVRRPRAFGSSELRWSRRRRICEVPALRSPSWLSLLSRFRRAPGLRHWPTRRLDWSPLWSWPGGTRLIGPERWRDSNGPWLSRSTRVGITERSWSALPRGKRWALAGRSRNWTRTGSRRDPLRRPGRNSLAWWGTPFLRRRKPGLRNRVSPLAPCSLFRSDPFRNRKRSLRCLRRFRNLTNWTTETRRFGHWFHVHWTGPRKDSRVRTALT